MEIIHFKITDRRSPFAVCWESIFFLYKENVNKRADGLSLYTAARLIDLGKRLLNSR